MTSTIDYSMIGDAQIFNLCLQRSSRLGKLVPSRSKAGDAWEGLMRKAVVEHRQTILKAVAAEIDDIFAKIAPQIETVAPKSLADIGCGQAFIDLAIYRRFGCDLVLIDIETSPDVHFGFTEEGAGYADLANARAFLVANGVPDSAITTINPRKTSLADQGPVDMAISLLSCGFHYPVETYDAFFKAQVKKAILLDCRNHKGGKKALSAYGTIADVGAETKHTRILCTKALVAERPALVARHHDTTDLAPQDGPGNSREPFMQTVIKLPPTHGFDPSTDDLDGWVVTEGSDSVDGVDAPS